MPLLDPYVAAVALPMLGGSAGFVVVKATQKRAPDGTPATLYDVQHLEEIKVTRTDFAEVVRAILPTMRSAALFGETAFLAEVSACARPQLRHLADSQSKLVPPGYPFSFVQLTTFDRRGDDVFPAFSRRDCYATAAVLASTDRLRVAPSPYSKALAAELGSVRTATTKSGRTDWIDRSPEKDVFLPALAVALFFAEVSIAAEGGRLISTMGD